MKIVCIEPIGIAEEEKAFYKEKFVQINCDIKYFKEKSEEVEVLKERIAEAEIVLLSNQKLPLEVYQSAKNLKLISVAFTGVDHIPLDYCKKNGINVCNAAGYSTNAVAELTFAMALELLRKLKENNGNALNGLDRQGYLGQELNGKVFGVIGMGAIGTKVAEIANAFGCNVIAYSRTEKKIENVKFVSLNELLNKSDIISIHIPLTNKTSNLIDEDKFLLMKQTAIIINTARGPIIDIIALQKALQNKIISGAAIDVYEYEPPLKTEHLLLKTPNCFLLPHIGYATQEAIKARTEIVMNNIFLWLNKRPQNLIV